MERTADVSTLFLCPYCYGMKDIMTDMNALLNAHTTQGNNPPPHIGFTSNVFPNEHSSRQGASSDYIPKEGHQWYVLRVTYNRVKAAYKKALSIGIEAYVPTHYVQKIIVGKKKRIMEPLLPNILFIYATRDMANALVCKSANSPSYIKYYLNRTLQPEANGKHPPLTIPFESMMNFIKATSTKSEHVRIVSLEQCHFKSGDTVRIIAGEFEGVTGKVARVAGQQRVVIEMKCLCLIATAYIPTDFIEIIT